MIGYRFRSFRASENIRLHIFADVLFITLAAFWVVASVLTIRGMASLPRLANCAPFEGPHFPRISILFAARDEAEKLPLALDSLLAVEYPDFEIVAVDDRSSDATPEILDEYARRNRRLKVIHISDLPQGWLGKPHALEQAYRKATGEWLIFTDADVRFAPGLLRRTLALLQKAGAQHLTLLAGLDLRGFWEPVAVGYLGVMFALGVRPWETSNPKSKTYMGVGAFQMIRRTAYEAIGTHRRLALEVLDDMKLGKLVKQKGFHSMVAPSENFLEVRWQEGIRNIIKGMTKNMFAGFNFSVARVLGGVLGIFLISIAPLIGVCFASGLAQLSAGMAIALAVIFQACMMPNARASRGFGFTHPLGAILVVYIILRSMIVTLARGGVVWRETFYPIQQLKRGMV